MECFAKDVNKLCFLSQDGTSHFVKKVIHAVVYVKTTGISDMSARIAVLLFITDQLIAIVLEPFFAVDVAQKTAIQLVSFQELVLLFKLEKASNQFVAMVSFVVSALFSKWEMIFGATVAE